MRFNTVIYKNMKNALAKLKIILYICNYYNNVINTIFNNMTDINNVGEFLKKHDVKPSYQRIKIFEYLLNSRNHPTVDEIFKVLVNNIPTLSKTTVYNTLKLFADKKIVIIINIEDNETRYDADTSNHGHFKCIKCGKVYDFDCDLSKANLKDIENFNITEYHFYLKGLCNKCKN